MLIFLLSCADYASAHRIELSLTFMWLKIHTTRIYTWDCKIAKALILTPAVGLRPECLQQNGNSDLQWLLNDRGVMRSRQPLG